MVTHRAATGLFMLSAISALCLAGSEKSELPSRPLFPQEGLGQFIVDRMDITTFRSSLGPRRSPGMRHFSDLGMKPTKVEDKCVAFDSEDWSLQINVLERADKNGDGVVDLVVEVLDQSKNGTYQDRSKLLLTRFSESGDLIALAFEP